MSRETTFDLVVRLVYEKVSSLELDLELQKAANQDLQQTNVALRKERDKAVALNETLLDALSMCWPDETDRFVRAEILGLVDVK